MTPSPTPFPKKATALDRWTLVQCPEGPAYVDLHYVAAIGPLISDTLGGITREMRLLYLSGGQSLVIVECAENLQALFDTQGLPS